MKRASQLALLAALAGAALHLQLLPTARREASDLPLYLDSSLRWATGEAPYREIPFEYPPAALLLLRVPLHLAAAVQGKYEDAFALWMALFDALALFAAFLAGDTPRRRWAALCTVWVALALCASVLHTRFDLAVGALMVLAVALLNLRRPGAAGAALGVAAALKLYPLAIAPALAVSAWRAGGLRKALLCGALAALLVSLPAGLAGGAATWTFFGYHWQRGVQLQSLWAAVILVAQPGVKVVHAFGAEQLAEAPRWLGPLSLLLQLGAGLGAAWAALRGLPSRAAAFAAFAGFVAFGKVGSPQFLCALAPLAAVEVPWAAAALLGSCALMAWEFPAHYGALFHNQGPWARVVLARMVLLGAAAIALVLRRGSLKPEP